MKHMWESLRHNRAEESKTPAGRYVDNNNPGKGTDLPEAAEKPTNLARQRLLRYKVGRPPARQLRVDRLKGLHLLLSALESPQSTSNGLSASVLRRSSSIAFIPESNESSTGTLFVEGNSLLHALDSQQLDKSQEFLLTDGTAVLENVTTPDSSKVLDSCTAIRAYCRLPTEGIKVGGLRNGSRMAGGKKGRRLKARNASGAEDRIEPVVQKVVGSKISHLDEETKGAALPQLGDETETSCASEERTVEVEYPASVNTDNVRVGQRPTCSLSEPDLATMEYNSGWLGDDHARRIASLLSEDFCDASSKEDEEIANKEFAGLLGDGEVLLIDELVNTTETLQIVSESAILPEARPHMLARHNSRKSSSGNIVLQLQDVAGDYGEAYEEMERRITVCNVVGAAVLKGMVRGIAEEATESVALKDKEMVELSKVTKEQDAKVAHLQMGLRRKEGELATLIKEFQFHETKYVGDLIREKEVVVQKSREKEDCLAKKEKELSELAQNIVYLSLQLDGESKKVMMLEKQMKDLRDAQALKVREIASLIEETERMKDDKESALEMVKRESRLRELRVKETLERVLAKKEEEIEDYKRGDLDYLDKIRTLESLESNLRQELSNSCRQIMELDRSKDEGLRLIDSLSQEIEGLKSQNEKLTALLEELFRQTCSRDEHVLELKDQARIASQESSIILDLWHGKMVDVLQMFKIMGKEREQEKHSWAEKLSDQGKVLHETLQELKDAKHFSSELEHRVQVLEAERESLGRKIAELSQDLHNKSKALNGTLEELDEVRDAKTTMGQEIQNLKLEILSLTDQLNKRSQQQELEAQENGINVQELERLQDVNGSMAAELLQLKCAVALHKTNLDKQSEKLDETRRCWADDKSNHSLILEDNRKELVSLRNLRETLEEQLRSTSSENSCLRQILEEQQKDWEDEEGRLSKELAAHRELLDEKSIELVGLRFFNEELEHKLKKSEQEKLASADVIGQLNVTLGERSAALGKLQNDFRTFVDNLKEVHQRAFEHGIHLESFKDDMLSEQWRLEMELQILTVYFGSSVEDIFLQADAFADGYSYVVEQLASCLNELEQKKIVLEEQAAEVEDVQAANTKLSDISNHLCAEIESCNEEISRCKIAIAEATLRADKSKSDFISLQKKMDEVRLSLEEKLRAQVSEISQLKSRLDDVDVQAKEKDWTYEAENSLILHAVDVWRDHMKEEVAGYIEEISLKDDLIAQLRLQLEPSQNYCSRDSLPSSPDGDSQKDEIDKVAIEWTLEVQAEILTVIFEDKCHELGTLLKASRQEVVDLVQSNKGLGAKESDNFVLQGEVQPVGSPLMTVKADCVSPTNKLEQESLVKSSEGKILSKIQALQEKVNQSLVDMDTKFAQVLGELEEQAWMKSLEVGILAHLLGGCEDAPAKALDGNIYSKISVTCLDSSDQEASRPSHLVMHDDSHAAYSGDVVKCTAFAHNKKSAAKAVARLGSDCVSTSGDLNVAADEIMSDSTSLFSGSELLRGPSMDCPIAGSEEQETEWLTVDKGDDTTSLWDSMLEENFEGDLVEEDELLKLVRRGSGQTSIRGLEDDARPKVNNNLVVGYLKAKMYAWSREKDMVIAEKTEQLYALKRQLLNEREKEKADIIRSKEREVEAIRKELEKKEQEEASSLEQGNLERDRILARLKHDWDAEKARLQELVHEKERDKDVGISKLAEEFRTVKLDLEETIAVRDSKILSLSEQLAGSKTNEDTAQARIDDLTQELIKLRSEMDEHVLMHQDDHKRLLGALEENENALKMARENFHIERSNTAALEAKLHDLEKATKNSVKALDVALLKVTSELQEERKQKQKLDDDLQSCKREVSLLIRESALIKKQVTSELAEQVRSLDKACQALEYDVAEKIQLQGFRLDGTHKQVKLLQGEKTSWQAREAEYKKKVQKYLRNLQIAEEEVDLLGDDVDFLSQVLEQVDEKLTKYKPVLIHYPGMMDLVTLVQQAVIQRMESKEAK